MWLVSPQRLLSLREIRRPRWDPLTQVTASRKGSSSTMSTQEWQSNKFSVVCTPISLLERVCYNETCFFPHNRPKITQEERREIVFESLVFL